MEPPHFAVERPQNDRWFLRGQTYLTNLQTAGTPAQAPGHALLNHFINEFIYNKEISIQHRNEADVVRTAALYLLHPVSQALNAHPSAHGAFSSQCEDTSVDGVRTDIAYFKPTTGTSDRAFAIIEFKRRTIIKISELNRAIQIYDPTAPTAATDLANIEAAIPAKDTGQTHRSFFMRDSHHLLKQAASYATLLRTRYVAIFDWDHLVCLYFPELDHTARKPDSTGGVNGNYVEIDVYPTSESHRMRLALLGFLEHAFVNTPP